MARRAVLGHLDRAAYLTGDEANNRLQDNYSPTFAANSASVTCSIQVT
jgi:hypothetical protein